MKSYLGGGSLGVEKEGGEEAINPFLTPNDPLAGGGV